MAQFKCTKKIFARRATVFDYLVNPKNLPKILSRDIAVELDNVSAPLAKGSIYSFHMTRYGLSQPVKISIQEVHKDSLLVYKQTQGLFQRWVHTQKFEDVGENETLVTDIVEYELPLGLIGHLLDDLWVKRDMTKILENRLELAASHFNH